MNKDKLIEAKRVVMYEIGQALEKANQHELNFNIQMMIASVLGDLTATLDDKLDEIIQSDSEEVCISKERLAGILIDYAEHVEDLPNWACDQTLEDALDWLNEKAGE